MRGIIITIFLAILFLSIQMTLFSSKIIHRVRPDLMMTITLYLSLSYPSISGGFLAFFFGYLVDLFSGNSFGLFAFTRPLIFYLALFFKDRFYLESFSSQSFFIFVFTILESVFIFILLRLLNPGPITNLYPLYFTIFSFF